MEVTKLTPCVDPVVMMFRMAERKAALESINSDTAAFDLVSQS